ncbi:hypothetical protein VTO42DRAFT_1517 [Malbranchea cinnamomea]
MLDGFELSPRSGAGALGGPEGRPPVFKFVGIALAVASGLFIGVSFVLKKVGLLKANVKYNEEAGEGYGYLRNAYWWGGMTLMIIGEVCNFVAYAFVDAILVTPFGALSVVVTTILSAVFLKERLSFVGMVGCFNCIVGSVVIAIHAPTQSSVSNIQDMKAFVITPWFLTYAGVLVVGCTFLALWAGPRYGKKNMFVYITICSLIGGLSVVATQGLGAAIVAQAMGQMQFKEWFLYVLLAFVTVTLLTEIVYLNKALNIFNAAVVTPTYYVMFTSATIITSAVLFQGFKGSVVTIITIIMGFLQICSGVILLQLSKSAKDVPDAAIFKGDLDQVREVAEQEQPETEPRADAIRGTAAIIRRISSARRLREEEELRRYHTEKKLDETEQPGENEVNDWVGLRRRRVISGASTAASRRHPPWGMSRFPEDHDDELETQRSVETRHSSSGSSASLFSGILRRISGGHLHPYWTPSHAAHHAGDKDGQSGGEKTDATRGRSNTHRSVSWAASVKTEIDVKPLSNCASNDGGTSPPTPPRNDRRQFSFQRIFSFRWPSHAQSETSEHEASHHGAGAYFGLQSPFLRSSRFQPPHETEEEALGLVKGDGRTITPQESSRSTSPTYSQPEFDQEMLCRCESVSSLSSSTASSSSEKRSYVLDDKELEQHLQYEELDGDLPGYDSYPSPPPGLRPLPLRPHSPHRTHQHTSSRPPSDSDLHDTHHLTSNPFVNPTYSPPRSSSVYHSRPRECTPAARRHELEREQDEHVHSQIHVSSLSNMQRDEARNISPNSLSSCSSGRPVFL